MQRLEVSCAVRPIYGSLGAKGLNTNSLLHVSAPQECHLQGAQTDPAETACILRHLFRICEGREWIQSGAVSRGAETCRSELIF
jgi:hypothetical protein